MTSVRTTVVFHILVTFSDAASPLDSGNAPHSRNHVCNFRRDVDVRRVCRDACGRLRNGPDFVA